MNRTEGEWKGLEEKKKGEVYVDRKGGNWRKTGLDLGRIEMEVMEGEIKYMDRKERERRGKKGKEVD